MKKQSAGLIMFRRRNGNVEVLLVHPGGPFWKNKNIGAWSIPKGEIEEGENVLAAAQREFEEELAIKAQEPFLPLGSVKQKSGKIVHAWAFCGDCDPSTIQSNFTRIEWAAFDALLAYSCRFKCFGSILNCLRYLLGIIRS